MKIIKFIIQLSFVVLHRHNQEQNGIKINIDIYSTDFEHSHSINILDEWNYSLLIMSQYIQFDSDDVMAIKSHYA